jgi:hypothetical protein
MNNKYNFLIFADIDGVLNDHTSHPRTRYCSTKKSCCRNFDEILIRTNAHFIITSSWRYLFLCGSMTEEGFKNLLFTHYIDATRFLGITRADDGKITDRGLQIKEWLIYEDMEEITYVVIDDGDKDGHIQADIIKYNHPFLQTDGSLGLMPDDIDCIIDYYNFIKGNNGRDIENRILRTVCSDDAE